MYATVRRYNDAGIAGRLSERGDEVTSVISAIPGFHAYYLINAGDETISVSVFDSEASAKQSNEEAASWLQENMPAISASAVSGGEVVLSS